MSRKSAGEISEGAEYLRQYGVHLVLEEALKGLLTHQPDEPIDFLLDHFKGRNPPTIRQRLTQRDIDKRLQRIYRLFIDKPVTSQNGTVYSALPLTDFCPPLLPQQLEEMADCLAYTSGLTSKDVDCIISIASRGAGALAHACSQRMGVPYTLCNWYPEGSAGDLLVEPSAGFSGKGSIFLNSVPPNARVVFVDDILRTGRTAGSVLTAVKSVNVTAVAALFVGEVHGMGGREYLRSEFPQLTVRTLACFSAVGKRTTAEVGEHGSSQVSLEEEPPSLPAVRYALPHRLSPAELQAKTQRVLQTFVGVPIQSTPSGYPYSNFQLTDFVPLMSPSLVEDIADITFELAYDDFMAADLVISESDRGGGPMTHACALRANKPYCLANWYSAGTDLSFGHTAYVGYSGEGRIFVNGVQKGQKVVVVDDMLSSGGTAEALFACVEQAGGIILSAVFASEKTNQNGRARLAKSYPHVKIITVCSFISAGEATTAAECQSPWGKP